LWLLLLVGFGATSIVLELYVRITRPYADLWVLTGREVGPDPIGDWADVDAFAAYRPRPAQYEGIKKSVNSHGFISTPELAIDKPTGTVRVASGRIVHRRDRPQPARCGNLAMPYG
jgi:hypothetical protein